MANGWSYWICPRRATRFPFLRVIGLRGLMVGLCESSAESNEKLHLNVFMKKMAHPPPPPPPFPPPPLPRFALDPSSSPHRSLEFEDQESTARPAAQVRHGLAQGRRKSSASCAKDSQNNAFEAATTRLKSRHLELRFRRKPRLYSENDNSKAFRRELSTFSQESTYH